MLVRDYRMARNAELAAQVEQVVLDGSQRQAHVLRQGFTQQDAKIRVQFLQKIGYKR